MREGVARKAREGSQHIRWSSGYTHNTITGRASKLVGNVGSLLYILLGFVFHPSAKT